MPLSNRLRSAGLISTHMRHYVTSLVFMDKPVVGHASGFVRGPRHRSPCPSQNQTGASQLIRLPSSSLPGKIPRSQCTNAFRADAASFPSVSPTRIRPRDARAERRRPELCFPFDAHRLTVSFEDKTLQVARLLRSGKRWRARPGTVVCSGPGSRLTAQRRRRSPRAPR